MAINIIIQKLRLGSPTQITVGLYIKDYYGGAYSLIEDNVLIDTDGTVLASPLPIVSIDPSQKYVLKAVNESCGFVYEQAIMFNPYCPLGYEMSDDDSYCFYENVVDATPPTNSENTVPATYFTYSCWGALVFDPGYGVNGVGTFTMIPISNPFWINGTGYPATGNYVDGPMNRSSLWATTTLDNQTIGFSKCVNVPTSGIYLVAIVGDNIPKISVDGNVIVDMDPVALGNYLDAHGFSGLSAYPSEAAFRFWNIYPIMLSAGLRVIQMTCQNTTGPAAIAAEIYNATYADLAAATSYVDLGSKLIFSTKDFIGQPVQIGSGGIGYSCLPGYSLKECDSPPTCIKIVTTPILY